MWKLSVKVLLIKLNIWNFILCVIGKSKNFFLSNYGVIMAFYAILWLFYNGFCNPSFKLNFVGNLLWEILAN